VENAKTAADEPAAEAATSWTDRLGLRALDYSIPEAANRWPYMLGGVTSALIVLLVLTGLYLEQFYQPTPVGARDSVLYIITRAPLGDWVRSVHYWASGALTVSLTAHLAYVFWRRSYRKPREVTWWAGVVLAAVVFLLLVTGTGLRGDQEGFEALAHFVAGGELTQALGGGFFTDGFTPSTSLLARIFTLHTSLLPLVLLVAIALHYWLIRHLGIHSSSPRTRSFRDHLVQLSGLTLLTYAAVGAVAFLAPEGLGVRAGKLARDVGDGDRARRAGRISPGAPFTRPESGRSPRYSWRYRLDRPRSGAARARLLALRMAGRSPVAHGHVNPFTTGGGPCDASH